MKKLSLLFAALLTATVMNLSAATAGKAPDMHDFLYFVGLNGNDTVRLDKYGTAKNVGNLTATFEYSKDRINWESVTWATDAEPKNTYQGNPIALAKGDTVFFRAKGTNGKNATVSANYMNSYFQFAFDADDQIAAGGNIMSLYDATCEQDTMTNSCFANLFKNAKQLVSAPKLPAKKVAEFCYNNMFQGCTSLTTAPALPATTMVMYCYWRIFDGCTSLIQAPELKATTLANFCYSGMFKGCTALTNAPELPATTMANSCYNQMFSGCTALTQAPELKATTLAEMCYYCMFKACTSLEVNTYSGSCDGAELEVPNPASGPNNWNFNMFAGCKGDAALTAEYGIQTGGHYCIKGYKDMHDFLYFVGLNGNDTVRLNKTNASLAATFQYSKDRINWSDYTWPDNSGKGGAAIELKNVGDTVFFRAKGTDGKNAAMSNGDYYFQFAFGADDRIAAGGNIMSLYDATCEQKTMTEAGFNRLFKEAKQLVSAPELPANKLASKCYQYMFYNCTSLTTAPALPATELENFCYIAMFYGCTNLVQAPELKATTLAIQCYGYMFLNCSSLEVNTFSSSCDGAELVIPNLASDPAGWNDMMFQGCKGTAANNIQLGGHYCIKKYVEPVCQIGTKGYESIAAAVAEVKAGDTIQVIKDIQLDAMISVPSTPAFTLDMNGHILDGSNLTGDNRSLIYNEGTLSIIDSNPTATHAAPFDTIAGAIMTGGKGYKSGTKTYGGAIYCDNGTLNVNGVAFVSNTAYTYGGVAYLQNPAANFVNCRFYGNNSTNVGGAALYINGSQCSVDSCTIKGNSAKNGIIRLANQASLTITHTTITDNTATQYPGAIGVWNSSLTLGDGTVITNNTSDANFPCGGIYVWNQSDYNNSITLSGKVIIKDNTSNGGQAANLCLSGDPVCDSITLNGLSAGSEVYVTTLDANDAPAPRTFVANATEADMQYFKSDNGYAFVLKEGKIASKQAYGRKVTSGNFGTICLTKQFIAMEGVEGLYVPYMVKDDSLYCEEMPLDSVKAGYAYIFKSNADSVTFALDGNATMAATEANYMKGWLANDYTLVDADVQAGGAFYGYYFLADNEITKPLAESQILKNRAMIQLPGAPSAPARGRLISFSLNDVNTTTGVEQVAGGRLQVAEKCMVNGQLVIIRDGKMFNAQGQEL